MYEMMLVRHGFMIVGYPFAGKTTAYKMLADALEICEENVSACVNIKETKLYTYNDLINQIQLILNRT